MGEHTDGLISELRDFPFFLKVKLPARGACGALAGHNVGVRFIGPEVPPFKAYIPR